MSATLLEEVLAKADLLTPEEQLQVIAILEEKSRIAHSSQNKPKRLWKDLVGLLTYPTYGQDAQEYVSQSRQEASDKRESQI